jgi:hypothetical protein
MLLPKYRQDGRARCDSGAGAREISGFYTKYVQYSTHSISTPPVGQDRKNSWEPVGTDAYGFDGRVHGSKGDWLARYDL